MEYFWNILGVAVGFMIVAVGAVVLIILPYLRRQRRLAAAIAAQNNPGTTNPPPGNTPTGATAPAAGTQVNLNVNPGPSVWQRWFVTPAGYISTPFTSGLISRNLLFAILAIVAAILIFHNLEEVRLYYREWNPDPNVGFWQWKYNSIAVGPSLVVIGIVLLALVLIGDWRKIVTGVLGTALLVYVFWLFKYDQLHDVQFVGMLYVVAVAVWLMLNKYMVSNAEKKLRTILVLGIFGILGLSHITTYSGTKNYLASWGGGSSSGQVASTPYQRRCSGIVQRAVLSTSLQEELNPGGNCHIELHEVIKGQCVYAFDRWNRLLGDDCSGGYANMDNVYPAKFSAASSNRVDVTYVLCERPGRLRVVADGCP